VNRSRREDGPDRYGPIRIDSRYAGSGSFSLVLAILCWIGT